MAVVVPPVIVAVKVEASPEHTVIGEAEIVATGRAFTVTVTVFEVKVPQEVLRL